MTGLLAGLLLTLAAGADASAAPALLEAQGTLRDAQGEPITGSLDAALTLRAGVAGEVVWSGQTQLQAAQGRFRVVLGDDPRNPLPLPAFAGPEQLWLGVQVDGELPMGRVALRSVPYALDAALALTATAHSLSCPGCVGPGALRIAVASLAELLELDDRVEAAQAAASALEGPTLGSLPCAEGQHPVSAGVGWVCRGELVAASELQALAIDAVDGLAGGTLQGDLLVTGAEATAGLRQAGELVCDTTGNCGASLADLRCGPEQVLRFGGQRWECADFEPPPAVPACAGADRALQWDGERWLCATLRASGPSQGTANGFESLDAWGYTWDGLERSSATWHEADAACRAGGGRLPTATELYRNNATTGTGNLCAARANNYLWTTITNRRERPVTVRLSDGALADATADSTRHFRCVWPDHRSAAFGGDACHGPPGRGCLSARRFYHLDREPRPAMDYVAASHECNFHNASLPTVADWTSMIHAGEAGPGDYMWLWAAGAMYHSSSPYFLMPVVRFDPLTAPAFSFTRTDGGDDLGGWAWPHSSPQAFRCMGKRSPDQGVDPSPECQGACFGLVGSAQQGLDRPGRRAPLWADSVDRPVVPYPVALADCERSGGTLPTINELAELLHAGLPNGTNAWLWTSSPLYVSGNYRYALGRWTGDGPRAWYATSGAASSDGEHGEDFRDVVIGMKHFESCKVGRLLAEHPQILVIAHFKGHILAGFGGAVKQLGMGCAARGGKLTMHHTSKPKIVARKCKNCGKSAEMCPVGAIYEKGRSHRIDLDKCIGCASCIAVCPYKAVRVRWTSINLFKTFGERLAEYAYAAQHGKRNIYMSFAFNITRNCDCMGRKLKVILPDLGVFASTDPVAIDQACLDLIDERAGKKKFGGRHTLEYAEKIGLGSRKYELVRL